MYLLMILCLFAYIQQEWRRMLLYAQVDDQIPLHLHAKKYTYEDEL